MATSTAIDEFPSKLILWNDIGKTYYEMRFERAISEVKGQSKCDGEDVTTVIDTRISCALPEAAFLKGFRVSFRGTAKAVRRIGKAKLYLKMDDNMVVDGRPLSKCVGPEGVVPLDPPDDKNCLLQAKRWEEGKRNYQDGALIGFFLPNLTIVEACIREFHGKGASGATVKVECVLGLYSHRL